LYFCFWAKGYFGSCGVLRVPFFRFVVELVSGGMQPENTQHPTHFAIEGQGRDAPARELAVTNDSGFRITTRKRKGAHKLPLRRTTEG
jgi:hypothetical protein